ncbi:MAG TPA: aminotransferase class I/II-fold pyridoxal phosphate-dependent enzyme [Dongiaceae bacterium]|nr:aminotransferase class I/II-fold pyridoxal phosphate-dependent enzyme [Dongiaceae bacterium]
MWRVSSPRTPIVRIPQADPARRLDRYRSAIDQAVRKVFGSGYLLSGPETAAFETEFAQYLGVRHAVAVSSGTAALAIALQALGIGPGDEVIAPALTAPATAGAIRRSGATPVFVDVDPASWNISPAAIESAIGPRTVAVVPVHLHGTPAALRSILDIAARHGLRVVEDCAQAHGASIDGRLVGTLGDVAAFSFYPTKNLGAAGDAGAIVTSDIQVAERARRLRAHGLDDNGVAVELGETGRIDEVQAAILRVLLPHLNDTNRERRDLAANYRAGLKDAPVALPPNAEGAVYHQFAVLVDGRDQVKARMAQGGILTGIHYGRALHQHPAFAQPGCSLPVAESLGARLLSLPIQPEVVTGRVEEVIACLLRSLDR